MMKIFVILVLGYAIMQANAKVTITSVQLESDPEYLKSQVSLKKVDGRVLVSGEGYLFKDINADIVFSGTLGLLTETSMYETFLRIDSTSFCKLATGKQKRPVLTMIWKMLQRYGSLPTSCPIRKGHYYVADFDLDDGLIPALAPSGSYKLEVVFAMVDELGTNKIIHKVIAYANIEPNEETESESEEMLGISVV